MKKKLQLGLLIDDYQIPAWVFGMLEKIISSEHSEISLIVKKKNSGTTDKGIGKIWNNRKALLFILFSKIENKLFKISPDAFEEKDLRTIVNCPEIEVDPRQTKFSDIIQQDDINLIKSKNIDVFIRLGFRILKGEILTCSRYGVWSFHHGDNKVNKGGPAGTWEVFNNWDETGLILQILTEELDGGTKLYESFSATDKFSVKRNRNNYYWKSSSILPRKLSELHTLGEEIFFQKIEKLNTHPHFYYNQLFKTPSNLTVIKSVLKIYSNWIWLRIGRIFFFDQWILLYRLDKQKKISTSFFKFKRIVPPKDRFWADPFVVEKNGIHFLFVEELRYKENKGKIAVIEIDEKGNHSLPKIALEKDYHLSYPFLFEENDDLYMIPETAQNNTIELYKCLDFPLKWELFKVLMKDIVAVDSTIFKHENKYWLFCNIKENEGASTHDELFLFYSEDLFSSHWTSHPDNPIVSDVKRSRPAGKIFTVNGKVYRPSQNSSKHYGYGMNINEIVELNEKAYREIPVQSIHPNWEKDITSTHTINNSGRLTVIDAQIKRRK